jgi:hypothetical protein
VAVQWQGSAQRAHEHHRHKIGQPRGVMRDDVMRVIGSSVRGALCAVRCALCTVHCALCAVHCALCAVRCALCAVRCVLCCVCAVLCCAAREVRCAVSTEKEENSECAKALLHEHVLQRHICPRQ